MTTAAVDRRRQSIRSEAAHDGRKPKSARRTSWRVFLVLVLAVMLVWTFLPIYWMLATSLKTAAEAAHVSPSLYPHHPTGSNYVGLFNGPFPFGTFLKNSVITSLITAAITVVLSALCGYSFARGKKKIIKKKK
jgi:multiple sugar transport system permease protein